MCIDVSQIWIAAVDGSVTPHKAALCRRSQGTCKAQFSRLLSIPSFFKLFFHVLSKDIRFLKSGNGSGQIWDDNLQLRINIPDCWAEMQKYKQHKWMKLHNHICQFATFVLVLVQLLLSGFREVAVTGTRSERQERKAGRPNGQLITA